MKIIFDAMGGDNAPVQMLIGASDAVKEYGIELIAVGDSEKIAKAVAENSIDMKNIRVVDAKDTIEMHDEPTAAIRNKKDSSMVVALRMLAAGEGDAVVSAGSTGALLVGAMLIVKRIKGVKRPGIGTVVPGTDKPYLLLDSGANAECRPEMLNAFATMGSIYMERIMKCKSPTAALVNIGAEETKGTPMYVQAHELLKKNQNINFIGNIEPKEIPKGSADVVVCDGFTGNIILKLTEGLAKSLMGEIKKVFLKNLGSKIAFLLVKSGLKEFKSKLDAEAVGGSLFIGVSKPVIKAHGSSKARAFKNAIRQAKECIENNIVPEMTSVLAKTSDLSQGEGEANE